MKDSTKNNEQYKYKEKINKNIYIRYLYFCFKSKKVNKSTT